MVTVFGAAHPHHAYVFATPHAPQISEVNCVPSYRVPDAVTDGRVGLDMSNVLRLWDGYGRICMLLIDLHTHTDLLHKNDRFTISSKQSRKCNCVVDCPDG